MTDRRPPSGVGPRSQAPHWSGRLRSASRQVFALAPALLLVWLLRQPAGVAPLTAWLSGWVAYCLMLLGLFGLLMRHLDAEQTEQRASADDPGSVVLFLLVNLACFASLFAVLLAVQSSHDLTGPGRWLHLMLVATSLALSWLLVHVAFALHYAREYYQGMEAGTVPRSNPGSNPGSEPGSEPGNETDSARTAAGVRGGLDFPGGLKPDYPDFFYFSVVIGMTSQVSDVSITSRRMRRLATAHGMLSFAFNLVILALAINVLASALG